MLLTTTLPPIFRTAGYEKTAIIYAMLSVGYCFTCRGIYVALV